MGMQVYTAAEVMPDQKDIKKIITAKLSYDKAKQEKTPADFDAWINSKDVFFKCAPRGLAYSVSQKSYDSYVATCKQRGWGAPKHFAPMALRYYVIAVAIGWDELIDELKMKLRHWGFTSAELQQYAKEVWQVPANIDRIATMVDKAINSKITLIEAVEKHKTLNPKLFTSEGILKTKVRDKMLEIVDEFLEDLKEQNIKIKIDDILFIGSNASYNYTKNSDIDLHILANTKATDYGPEVGNALYSAYRSLFNKRLDISFYGIPLEIYVETENSPRESNGVYSVKKNKWVKKPIPENIPEYDKEALDKLVSKWEDKYKKLVDDIKADKLPNENKVVKLLADIYDVLRKKGVAKGEYSTENLAFKELRNKGYLDKLKEYRNELTSKRLSLEEELSRRELIDRYTQIARAAHGNQPIVQPNGMFYIYNLKASDISSVVQRIRQLPFVQEVYPVESGKYDFSQMARTNLPTKYYNIRGRIVDSSI